MLGGGLERVDGSAAIQGLADIVQPDHAALAREFRALTASYEANRDLVLMGAYRAGADAQLDRAITMHDALVDFLCQPARSTVPLDRRSVPSVTKTLPFGMTTG